MKKFYVTAALGVAFAASLAIPEVRAISSSAYKQLTTIVSAADPVAVVGQSAPLSIDTNSRLRVNSDMDDRGACHYTFSANFTPQATAAVTLLSVKGSASKTIRIKRILLSGHSTANAQEIIALQRTSALGAGGTVVSPTAAKIDSSCAAATAVVSHYTTSLKAAGTATDGPLATQDFVTGVVTTPTILAAPQVLYPLAGGGIDQAIVLRGTSDFLELQNVNAGNLSAATVLQYTIELEEE